MHSLRSSRGRDLFSIFLCFDSDSTGILKQEFLLAVQSNVINDRDRRHLGELFLF